MAKPIKTLNCPPLDDVLAEVEALRGKSREQLVLSDDQMAVCTAARAGARPLGWPTIGALLKRRFGVTHQCGAVMRAYERRGGQNA